MEDYELVRQCIKGNSRAQKALFDKYAPKMFSVCMRYMKKTEESEDALQDSFVKIFSKLSDFKYEGVLEGWIRRIVVNSCLDQIRKNSKFLNDVQAEEVEYKLEQNSFIAENLMAEDLMKLIQRMPDGYRIVFNMFAIEGYSHQEIAAQLGVTESTSKSQYVRARAYLRERIEKR